MLHLGLDVRKPVFEISDQTSLHSYRDKLDYLNFAYVKFNDHTLHRANIITKALISLVCTFDVRMQQAQIFLRQDPLLINPYKPSILIVGHRQTAQTQIRRHRTQHLIRVSTICLQNVLLEFE